MKIIVFGTSGGTGLEVVKQALEAGYIVIAFVRTPSKMNIQHSDLTLLQGDVMNAAAMKKHGILRIVSTTGAGVRQPEDQPKFMDHFIGMLLNLLAKEVLLDSVENVNVIQSSDLEWTIVRFPRLANGAHTGNRVGYVSKESSTQFPPADGVAFVL